MAQTLQSSKNSLQANMETELFTGKTPLILMKEYIVPVTSVV